MKWTFLTLALFAVCKTGSAQLPCDIYGGPQQSCHGCGGADIEYDYLRRHGYPFGVRVEQLRSADPNDITGPAGYGPGQWVSVNDQLQYTVRFENDPKLATGPAQNVFVHIPVHPGINGNTLKLGSFGFGRYHFSIPPNSTTYATRLDLRDSLGLYVDVTAGLDILQNEVFWTFKSIDPATGLPVDDQARGFLPVNDTTAIDSAAGPGEGYVTFLLTPRKTLLTGDTLSEQASIVFDKNEPLPTNVWPNTVDAFPPVSQVNGATASGDTIRLHWSGVDDAGGVGLRDYTLYVSEDGGPYTIHQKNLTDTSGIYVGTVGSTYRFFTLSTDNVGNKEALKTGAEATVSLVSNGTPLPITWLYFEGRQQLDDVVLTWAVASERDCKSYVVERSPDGRVFAEIGVVAATGTMANTANYRYLDAGAARLNAERLFYRIRQVSNSNASVYSRTVVIPLNHDESGGSVTAYPNPFSNVITLQVLNVVRTEKDDIVQIYSLDGRLRYQKPLVLNGASTVLLDDLPLLEPGNYLLKAVIGKQLFTVKMTRK